MNKQLNNTGKMIRNMINKNILSIFDATTKLLVSTGFINTKMKDVAESAELSVGTLYNIFDNKETLLNFTLLGLVDKNYLFKSYEYPITNADTQQLLAITKKTYQTHFDKIKKTFLVKSDNSFYEYLDELFENIYNFGLYFLIIEKNQQSVGPLLGIYKRNRKAIFTITLKFLKAQEIHGKIRPLDYPEYDATLIIDLIAWWCVHKRYDSFEQNVKFSKAKIKTMLLTTLTKSYIN